METSVKVQASSPQGVPVNLATTVDDKTLVVGIAEMNNGKSRILALEAAFQSDLTPARDKTWWDGVRAGRLPPDLGRLSMKLTSGPRQEADLVDDFILELSDEGHSFEHHFSVDSLSQTAERALERLLNKKETTLNEDSKISYFLVARHIEQDRATDQPAQVRARIRREPLMLEEAPLEQYLRNSEPLAAAQAAAPTGPGSTLQMPVFFKADSWAKGHQFARRGNDLESAGIWTGRLMRDTKSPEVFMVVDACIDAKYADEEKYSVTFSGATWSRVRQVLQQRRRRLNRPQEIILGSVHGHNFTPGSKEGAGRLCDTCPDLSACRKTTAVLSMDDLKWHKSVFAAQPYAMLTLWGWTARKEEVWQCYSMAGATLISRPVRMLE